MCHRKFIDAVLHKVLTWITPLCKEAKIHGRLGWKLNPLHLFDFVSNLVNCKVPGVERGEIMSLSAHHNNSALLPYRLCYILSSDRQIKYLPFCLDAFKSNLQLYIKRLRRRLVAQKTKLKTIYYCLNLIFVN